MKKKPIWKCRVIMSIICSLILFCMPVGAYMANNANVITVLADDSDHNTETKEAQNETVEAAKGEEASDQATSESTLDESVSGGDSEDSETDLANTESSTEVEEKSECICTERCSQYAVNKDCEHCKENYNKCEYINPNVVISIKSPDGWYNSSAKVRVSVEDVLETGNFVVATIEAKIGQSGSWTDITDDRVIEISENCSVYVRVTDQKGKEYEKNRAIRCFDRTKPTLNAAVNDGSLSVQASDTDSGVKAIYVNGYEFKDLTNGTLNIRLQQFDSGYQYFTIQALDNAGNLSEVYKTQNPYYTDPTKEDDSSGNKNPASSLPVNANATAPSSATGNVTEHVKTDANGNAVTNNKSATDTQNLSPAEQKKQAMKEADAAEQGEGTDSEQGKEFYTIQTASEKVFYLIIDRDGDDEKVYFLTEISENDLLNTVDTTSDTLPMNSAALDNGIPTDSALPNNNVEVSENTTEPETEDITAEEGETEEEPAPAEEEKKPIKDSTLGTYILFGVLGAGVIGAAYFLKIKKKKEDYLDEDDDTEEEPETFENEDEEAEEEDDFFSQDDMPQTSEEDVTETIDDEDDQEEEE